MRSPLSFIFESKIFPHARTLRTTLKQKFLDSMKVVSGTKNQDEFTFGLFDFLTFGIPAALEWLTMEIVQRYEELSMEGDLHPMNDWEIIMLNTVRGVNFLFNQLPRFLVSALVAVIAFIPITLPVHLVAKAIDYSRADSLEVALSAKDAYGRTLQEELLVESFDDEEITDLEEIEAAFRTFDKKVIKFYSPYVEGKRHHETMLNRFDYDKDNYAIRAMFTHNIGNIAYLYPEEANEIAEGAIIRP
ncbi:MAG: hypothetical protein H0U57_01685 [Tatlockia sp.]|nr:hypothetical protein [Tatlockia sp.]